MNIEIMTIQQIIISKIVEVIIILKIKVFMILTKNKMINKDSKIIIKDLYSMIITKVDMIDRIKKEKFIALQNEETQLNLFVEHDKIN